MSINPKTHHHDKVIKTCLLDKCLVKTSVMLKLCPLAEQWFSLWMDISLCHCPICPTSISLIIKIFLGLWKEILEQQVKYYNFQTIGNFFFGRSTNLVLLSIFVLTWACDRVNEILSPVENAALDTLRRRPLGAWTGQVAVIGRYLSEFSTPPTQWSAATFRYLSTKKNILL